MLPVTLNGEDLYLLHYRPDWSGGFSFTPAKPSAIDRSLSGREARTPEGETLRSRLAFQLQLYGRESPEFRVALQRLKASRILCPFWPAAHGYAAEVIALDPEGNPYLDETGQPYTLPGPVTPWIVSGLWFTFEQDYSAWEVHTENEPTVFTPSATALRVPLIMGRFEEIPDPPALTDRLLEVAISFREDSPAAYALVPTPVPAPDGPAVLGTVLPVFPLLPDWSTPPKAGGATVEIELETLGRGRETAPTYYPQESARRLSAGFQLYQWAELAALLSFFDRQQGQVSPFWLPGLLAECSLVEAALSTDTILSVDEAALIGDNRYLSHCPPGGAPTLRRILSVDTEANTLTLDSPLGYAIPAGDPLECAILVRFARPEITLRFTTDILADVTIDFVEVPAEYANPTGEILGQTMGAGPASPYLYRFIRAYPAETVIDAMTDWERPVLAAGVLHQPRGIEHDSITDSADPDQSKVTISLRNYPGNPLWLLFANAIEIPIDVEISQCTLDAEGNALAEQLLFAGTIQPSSTKSRGPVITTVAGHRLALLAQKIPVPVMEEECNWDFGSTPCGIALSDWTWSAVVVAISDATLTLGTFVRTNGGASVVFGTDWFQGGRLWCGTLAADYAQRTVYTSTALAAGQVTVALSRGFLNPPAVGSTVYLQPGCDRSVASCRERYNNYSGAKGFGGFPFMPTGNRSFVFNRSTANPTSQKK